MHKLPDSRQSVPESNDIEQNVGVSVAVDAIDGSHGGPHPSRRGTNHHRNLLLHFLRRLRVIVWKHQIQCLRT